MTATQEIPAELRQALSDQTHRFLQPTTELHESILQLSKDYLDPLAADVTEAQSHRQVLERQNKKKRKRRRIDELEEREELLRMKRIHMHGFDVEQIWQQARRVLGAAETEVERDIPGTIPAMQAGESEDNDDDDIDESSARITKATDPNANGFGAVGVEDDSAGGSVGGESVDRQTDLDDISEDQVSAGEISRESLSQNEDSASCLGESHDAGNATPLSDVSENAQHGEVLVKDRHGLNDGFFSIDQFNRQSELLERQDAKGDPEVGAASDEEEIDWAADPLAPGAQTGLGKRESYQKPAWGENDAEEDAEDEDDEDPTFGHVDLDAPEGASDEDIDSIEAAEESAHGMGADFTNTNDILYKDFFAPPAHQRGPIQGRYETKHPEQMVSDSKSAKRGHPAPDKLAKENDLDASEEEVRRAMSSVRRDIFEDSGDEEDEELESDVNESSHRDERKDQKEVRQNLSTHERRQVAFRKRIQELEAENVAPKPFTLTGETIAPARPENALLEEDLDFERVGKPVPVITQEVNESIEELIKRRVLAREFDNLIKRAPEVADLYGGKARNKPAEEVPDAKSRRGLADEYASEYLRKSDPNYVDSRSEVLKAEHATIERQWKEICAALDSLSNWHYKPRPPEASVEVRTDAPVVQMEEARPAGVEGIGDGASSLAPQEIYRAGDQGKRQQGLVTTKGGTVVAKEEESRESRRRRRQRHKERKRKAESNKPASKENAKSDAHNVGKKQASKATKEQVVGQLKKGGVKIIGKKGDLKDVEGRGVGSNDGGKSVATYVL